MVLGAMPLAAFLVSLSQWWQFAHPTLALWIFAVAATATVAGLAALAPRSPTWLAPGILAGLTFGALTLDAVIGTPLNRSSPLGAAPTFGARFYGFGNPTFSGYAVAGLVFAAALAQWLPQRQWPTQRQGERSASASGARRPRLAAALAVAVIGSVAMVIDVMPAFGADLGGGLVLIPAFAVVALAAYQAKVTWLRVGAIGVVGVAIVAAIGVADWLRPPTQRSHLGQFVAEVIDGQAFATIARKAGYAARSMLGGPAVYLTIALLAWCALWLFAPRYTPAWFRRCEQRWPLLRPAVLGIWIAAVAGSLVNDFGARIAMIALIPAVPLLLLAALDAAADDDP
jgi:hypothetical protein